MALSAEQQSSFRDNLNALFDQGSRLEGPFAHYFNELSKQARELHAGRVREGLEQPMDTAQLRERVLVEFEGRRGQLIEGAMQAAASQKPPEINAQQVLGALNPMGMLGMIGKFFGDQISALFMSWFGGPNGEKYKNYDDALAVIKGQRAKENMAGYLISQGVIANNAEASGHLIKRLGEAAVRGQAVADAGGAQPAQPAAAMPVVPSEAIPLVVTPSIVDLDYGTSVAPNVGGTTGSSLSP